MNLVNRLELLKRETCGDYNKRYCLFSADECFHSLDNRCYRLIPRKEEELMEWMDLETCADCSEGVCNYCDIHKDYFKEKTNA